MGGNARANESRGYISSNELRRARSSAWDKQDRLDEGRRSAILEGDI